MGEEGWNTGSDLHSIFISNADWITCALRRSHKGASMKREEEQLIIHRNIPEH